MARLETIREKALRALPDNAYDPEKAMAQIDDLPEIYWAAVPFPEGKYQEARAQVEALLAARKNTRNFQSAKGWAGNEEKSSLDGWRESVLPNHRRKENETLIQQLEKCGIKKGETLCGVGLLKRFGKPTSQKEDESFASIPHIAAWPLIASLKDANKDANKNDFDEYVEFLRERNIHSTALYRPAHPSSDIFPYDGHILFEEQLKEYFNEETQQSELQQAKVKLSELLKKIGAKPSPYYAILHADGDRMGEAIDAQTTAENHHKLSKALSAFAGEVKTIVSQHHGSLIYAGGDDVLALVPLHTAIQCARKLADTFGESLRAFNAPTLSVGIAIAHQMEPLEDIFHLAREAEREAKQLDGKNALCLKVSKRSGSVTTVKGKWGEIDERLKSFTAFHEREEIPDGAAYELRRLAEDFKGFADAHKAEAYRKEATRILSRKRAKRSTEEIKKDVQEKLLSQLSTDPQKAEDAIRSLADELIVARLFVNRFAKKGESA